MLHFENNQQINYSNFKTKAKIVNRREKKHIERIMDEKKNTNQTHRQPYFDLKLQKSENALMKSGYQIVIVIEIHLFCAFYYVSGDSFSAIYSFGAL